MHFYAFILLNIQGSFISPTEIQHSPSQMVTSECLYACSHSITAHCSPLSTSLETNSLGRLQTTTSLISYPSHDVQVWWSWCIKHLKATRSLLYGDDAAVFEARKTNTWSSLLSVLLGFHCFLCLVISIIVVSFVFCGHEICPVTSSFSEDLGWQDQMPQWEIFKVPQDFLPPVQESEKQDCFLQISWSLHTYNVLLFVELSAYAH